VRTLVVPSATTMIVTAAAAASANLGFAENWLCAAALCFVPFRKKSIDLRFFLCELIQKSLGTRQPRSARKENYHEDSYVCCCGVSAVCDWGFCSGCHV
jgi:hypothetical protein